MKKKFGCTLTAMGFVAGTALAASLDSPAPPTDGTSAMPTVNGIYDRLTTGAASPARTGAFTEPGAGPASSSHTLREVLDAAPAVDTVNGAAPEDVQSGKNYWSLRTDSRWGLQAGTAPAAGVPKTGQATCYDAAGGVIGCTGTGQDGALQPGVAWPNPRFTDNNNNGTVTDNLTGLIWLRKANCTDTVGGVGKGSGTLTWTDALTWSKNLANGTCGLGDGSVAGNWRLPSRFELESLITARYSNPALANTAGTEQWTSNAPFLNVQSGDYWSSSTYVGNTSNAWYVNLGDGDVNNAGKGQSYYVWPVRGGQ